MKKIMILPLLLFVAACGGEEEMFSCGGTEYRLTGTPDALPALLAAGKPAALRFSLAGYSRVMQALAASGKAAGVDLKAQLADELLVCAACRRRLLSREIFELLHMAGKTEDEKRCPACGGATFVMFFKRSSAP